MGLFRSSLLLGVEFLSGESGQVVLFAHVFGPLDFLVHVQELFDTGQLLRMLSQSVSKVVDFDFALVGRYFLSL